MGFRVELCGGGVSKRNTLDDINPALPIIRNAYHKSHTLGSLRYCRIQSITVGNVNRDFWLNQPGLVAAAFTDVCGHLRGRFRV